MQTETLVGTETPVGTETAVLGERRERRRLGIRKVTVSAFGGARNSMGLTGSGCGTCSRDCTATIFTISCSCADTAGCTTVLTG